MADYIKFRLTAAKVGVSMALLALIAGLSERAQAKPSHVSASPASSAIRLKLTGLSSVVRGDLLKLDKAFVKIDTALTSFEHKMNTTFLRITSANAEFLKIDVANSEYLKIDAANSQFLKSDATAVNSAKLAGLTPDAFFQGHGDVVSGSVTLTAPGQPAQLLERPGGIIAVTASVNSDLNLSLTIHNGTAAALPGVQDLAGLDTPVTLPPNADTNIALGRGAVQLHLQIFPNGAAFPNVVTLIVSSEGSSASVAVHTQVVGQAFAGAV